MGQNFKLSSPNPDKNGAPKVFICHHEDCRRHFIRKTSLTNHLKAHNNLNSRSIYRSKRARLKAAAAFKARHSMMEGGGTKHFGSMEQNSVKTSASMPAVRSKSPITSSTLQSAETGYVVPQVKSATDWNMNAGSLVTQLPVESDPKADHNHCECNYDGEVMPATINTENCAANQESVNKSWSDFNSCSTLAQNAAPAPNFDDLFWMDSSVDLLDPLIEKPYEDSPPLFFSDRELLTDAALDDENSDSARGCESEPTSKFPFFMP